jgi:hypothetical protein
VITRLEELKALYGVPVETSIVKEVDRDTPHNQAFIEASPSAALAPCGPEAYRLRADPIRPVERDQPRPTSPPAHARHRRPAQ